MGTGFRNVILQFLARQGDEGEGKAARAILPCLGLLQSLHSVSLLPMSAGFAAMDSLFPTVSLADTSPKVLQSTSCDTLCDHRIHGVSNLAGGTL